MQSIFNPLNAEYSVVVKTKRKVNDYLKFEPYRGYDRAAADRAFDAAEDRLKAGEITLWKLTSDAGVPLRTIFKGPQA